MNQANARLTKLYDEFASGAIGRREFMSRAVSMGIAGAAAAALAPLAAGAADAASLAQRSAAASTKIALDIAEWSYI
jgi:hypothetical protein